MDYTSILLVLVLLFSNILAQDFLYHDYNQEEFDHSSAGEAYIDGNEFEYHDFPNTASDDGKVSKSM